MQINRRAAARIGAVVATIAVLLAGAATGAHAVTTGVTADGGAVAAQAALTEGPFMLVNERSRRCLNVAGGSTANGANVIQYDCSPGAGSPPYSNNLWYRTWAPEPDVGYYIWSYHSALCLNVYGGSTANGANVIQYSCIDHPANRWRFGGQTSGGAWYIWNVNSESCLNVAGGSTANGANVIQYSCTDHPANRWYIRWP